MTKIDHDFEKWLIDIRRHLHQYPELSEKESETQQFIEMKLDELKIEHVRTAETGVMGIIRGNSDSPCVALRADIDALPIKESNAVQYKSKNKGVMHACGHDAHTTILLGCARKLAERPQLDGTIKLFFQPAEETVGGAKRMVEEGCMKNPKVDYVFGLHVVPYMPVGEVEIRHGKLNAASDHVKIVVNGLGTHGAYPEKWVDALLVASEIVVGIQVIITRKVSPLYQVVFSLGKIKGGSKDNIICDHVEISGIMRTTDEETRRHLKRILKNYISSICDAHEARGEIIFEEGYQALINDYQMTEIVRKNCESILGADNVHEKETPSLGVEDFSFFLDHAKGAFYHLGCGRSDKFDNSPIHSDTFDIDESVLGLGVELQLKIIDTLIGGSDEDLH
jgi:amidohydrolase